METMNKLMVELAGEYGCGKRVGMDVVLIEPELWREIMLSLGEDKRMEILRRTELAIGGRIVEAMLES